MCFQTNHLWISLIVSSLIFLGIELFFGYILISLTDNENKCEYCKFCNFTPVIQPNSTVRDLIMTATTKYSYNLQKMVRSIRTSGCVAKIVIFTTDNVKLPKSLTSCGVEQIITNSSKRASTSPHKIRWEWYYQYLQNNFNRYDRVMHVDAFDTFFFGDPFAFASDFNTLYFQQEGKTIRRCNFNTNWLLSCHKDAKNKRIINNMILCSGSLIGGMNPFFQFTKLLITDDQWKNCWNAGFDQGDFNYIFYTKWQKFANFSLISTKLLTCEDRFMTLFYCMKPPVSLNGKNQIQSPRTNNTIIFMHQYNRFLNLSLFTNQICK